jgi:hypothetical protein
VRTYRAGDNVEDLCRACKIDRDHTVIAADAAGRPIRVQCDYCGSQHNFRGGTGELPAASAPAPQGGVPLVAAGTPGEASDAAPALARQERVAPPIAVGASEADLEEVLRRVLRMESGITVAVPAEKWRGGQVVLRPGKPGPQEKTWPIETFFHKIVMIRNRLRTLEQQVNSTDLPEDVKIKLQAYITGCYGSLTSFNVLFADEADQFKGAAD